MTYHYVIFPEFVFVWDTGSLYFYVVNIDKRLNVIFLPLLSRKLFEFLFHSFKTPPPFHLQENFEYVKLKSALLLYNLLKRKNAFIRAYGVKLEATQNTSIFFLKHSISQLSHQFFFAHPLTFYFDNITVRYLYITLKCLNF